MTQETKQETARAIDIYNRAYEQLRWNKNPNVQDLGLITPNCAFELGLNMYKDGSISFYVVLHEEFGESIVSHVFAIKRFDQEYQARGYIKDLQEQAVREDWR